MIILEGVDKAGKTTLARRLSDMYGIPIDKCGIPKGNPIPGYIQAIKDMSAPVIWDRFIYGEIPYSIVKKRTRYMQSFELDMLELMLATMPTLVVYVRPPRQVIQDRHSMEPDSYVSKQEALMLYEEYDELTAQLNIPVFEYRGDQDFEALTEMIEKRECFDYTRWETYRIWKRDCAKGIGTLYPKYLFVGEQLNTNAKVQVQFWSIAGEYLLRCLRRARIDLRECHFTNSFNFEGGYIKKEDVAFLGPQVVVGMGAWAGKRLKDAKIQHNLIEHPGYWRRFHHEDSATYAEKLRKACSL